ncbi:hypothetical protein FRACYDRAFT_255694 [Fragilariopsis cylindrus CCMP1102]|uniref:Uncharacterized protein n=1 Tax=Fragilariopsis cylindrus CCMP1102 TaxID=635003 RepID=A0A1E7EK05_9STRA|nr:hypothetical protein FRACYDRAFT_255694 [Fragilariopsis cylindrus CCMP1102]|eukprot:OEU06208.1 hypothetical protein FRACYDRAFT_255694 [Fragilariopsis cylindrus CCMP1102]
MTTSKPDEEQDIETGGEAPATAVTKNDTTNSSGTVAAAAAGDNDNETTAVATTEGSGGDDKKKRRKKKKKQSATSDGEGRPSAITMDEEGTLTPAQGTTPPPMITPQDTRTIATINSGLSIDQQTMMTQITTQFKDMEKDRIVREEIGINQMRKDMEKDRIVREENRINQMRKDMEKDRIVREENRINQMRLPLVGMLVSSVVLLVAVVSWKGPPMWKSDVWRGYAIAYPCMTLVISLLGVLKMCHKEFYLNNGKFIHVLLFLWNFVGACLLTFLNPFTKTGNGYFAAWGTVVCAAGALGIHDYLGCNNYIG